MGAAESLPAVVLPLVEDASSEVEPLDDPLLLEPLDEASSAVMLPLDVAPSVFSLPVVDPEELEQAADPMPTTTMTRKSFFVAAEESMPK